MRTFILLASCGKHVIRSVNVIHHASNLYAWLGGMTNLFIDTPRWVSVLRSRHINNIVVFFVALGSYEYSSWGYRVEFLAGNWALTARRRRRGNTLAASCCPAAAVDTRKFEAFFATWLICRRLDHLLHLARDYHLWVEGSTRTLRRVNYFKFHLVLLGPK